MHFYKQSVKDLGFLVTGCFLCKVFCQPQRSAKYNLQAHCSVLKTMALKVSVKIFLKLSEDIVKTCHGCLQVNINRVVKIWVWGVIVKQFKCTSYKQAVANIFLIPRSHDPSHKKPSLLGKDLISRMFRAQEIFYTQLRFERLPWVLTETRVRCAQNSTRQSSRRFGLERTRLMKASVAVCFNSTHPTQAFWNNLCTLKSLSNLSCV